VPTMPELPRVVAEEAAGIQKGFSSVQRPVVCLKGAGAFTSAHNVS
jgi:hypothetical protein